MHKRYLRYFYLLVALPWLAACTPQEQAFSPATKQSRIFDNAFIATPDTVLPLRMWLPEARPKAIVIALHGFNDYSSAFELPGEYLAEHGIALFAYDQRGFGKTPFIGLWASEANLVSDATQITRFLRAQYPETPLYLLGESMGGAVAIASVAQPDFPRISGLILSAPAIWGEDSLHPLYRISLWTIAHIVPDRIFTGSDLKILATDNIPVLRRMSADPLVLKQTRADAIYGLVHLMDKAHGNIGKLNAPTLLLYGAKDQVIPLPPMQEAVSMLPDNARVAYYPTGYHMLLRDLERDTVLADMVSWIKNPAAPLPSGFDRDSRERLGLIRKTP